MIDDISDIQSYYDATVESEDARLERHQLEHDITWCYLEKYLPAKGTILEIGAATGGYTVELARRGYTVTAIDLSPKLLEVCQQRVSDAGLEKNVEFFIADARDLSTVKGDSFDAALLMGPLYHLVLEEDRKKALREVFNRLKPGGIIYSAFISRYGVWGDVMKNIPHWIEKQSGLRSIMERGREPDDTSRIGFRGYFAKASEIAPLHEGIGFKKLVVAGVEPAISADDKSYNILEGARRKLWLDFFYEISIEESIIAASRHLLYVGMKPE